MASQKLSQLSTITDIQSSDLYYVVRGAADVAITGASLVAGMAAALGITFPAFGSITLGSATTRTTLLGQNATGSDIEVGLPSVSGLMDVTSGVNAMVDVDGSAPNTLSQITIVGGRITNIQQRA